MKDAMGENAIKAAEMLMNEHVSGARFHPFAAGAGAADLAGAYAIQREYVRLQMQARGIGAAGYKVGLTSPRMQAMCKIDRPIAGVVLKDRVHRSGVSLEASRYGRVGLEFEIAVRLGRDLKPGDDVAGAIEAVCPAVEIVDDRHCDYATLDVLSLVADNSWNAGIVLGEFSMCWPDLETIEGVVSSNGQAADRGWGRDVLGHPFNSVAWVAQHLGETGQGLHAGDIVMTGNLVTTKFPAESSIHRFELQGLGFVELSIRV
ncbi:MAG TPA: fumarylacetoacetate hydrolase family protein [Magnetospirillaceae bacterium]|jgi:2-keto-4-pentenoate hydratase